MKTYSLSQIQQIIKTDAVKYARLETENGELVYGFNTGGKDKNTIEPHIKKICNALKNSKTLTDGIYNIICTNGLGAANTQRIVLPYKKGTGISVVSEKVYEARPIKQETPRELISYNDLLKLHQELAEKTFTIKALESEKKEQAEYIVELEADLITQDGESLDEPGELSPQQQAMNTLMSTGVKILDRFADKLLGEDPEAKQLSDKPDQVPKITEAQIYKLLYNNPQLVNGFNEYIKQQLETNGQSQTSTEGQTVQES